jgi:hypothetical protein
MIPEPMPDRLPLDTLSYVISHLYRVTPMRLTSVLTEIAYLDRDGDGRVSVADVDLARIPTQVSLQTTRKHLRDLLAEGTALKLDGDTYVIPGAAEHDCLTCDHRVCARKAEVARRADEWYRVANRPRVRSQRRSSS